MMKKLYIIGAVFMLSIFVYSSNRENLSNISNDTLFNAQAEIILSKNDIGLDCLTVELFRFEVGYHFAGDCFTFNYFPCETKKIKPLPIYGFV